MMMHDVTLFVYNPWGGGLCGGFLKEGVGSYVQIQVNLSLLKPPVCSMLSCVSYVVTFQ